MRKGAKIHVGDLGLFTDCMDKLGVIKTKAEYHEPIFSLVGLDVLESSVVPKNQAWLVAKDGAILEKYNLNV